MYYICVHFKIVFLNVISKVMFDTYTSNFDICHGSNSYIIKIIISIRILKNV